MSERRRFPNRRSGYVAHMRHRQINYQIGFAFFGFATWDLGEVGEIFISSDKPGSNAEECARDGAILASHALQRGATITQLAASVTRGDNGEASTLIGAAIDLVARESRCIKAERATIESSSEETRGE